MTEPSSYDVDVDPGVEQVNRRSVPKYMGTDMAAWASRKLNFTRVPTDDLVDAEPRERMAWARLEHR